MVVAAGTQALVPQAAGAQAPPRPGPVPPLVSEPLRVRAPQLPAGDFRNPPDVSPDRALPEPKASFDPARSRVLDDQTTPTRRTWQNDDHSFTTELAARAVRYFDAASGSWKAVDLTVAARPDGVLAAKAAPGAARLGAVAAGDLATVDTPAGPVTLRQPDALPVPAAPSGGTVRYAKALPGGRDVELELTPDGFKETVVLPNAASGATYREQIALPAGATARQGPAGVDFVDASGSVFATYGGGVATDATFPRNGPLAAADVSVRLVSAERGLATVEVGVSPEWLAAARFPVRIDPLWRNGSASTAIDSFVSNPDSYSSSPSTHPWLVTGSDGTTLLRSLLRFDLSGFPTPGPGVVVSEAHVSVRNWYTYGYSCTPGTVSVYGLNGAFDAATRWATQPNLSSETPVSSKTFAHNNNVGSACPEAVENLDATALARAWLSGSSPNHGLTLRAGNSAATETQTANLKAFYSAEGTPVGLAPPTLSITYNQLPGVSTPVSPADGVTLADPSPTLTASAVADPDIIVDPTQTTRYWFRVGTGPTVEGGHQVDSGWLSSPTWTVPEGSLRDGVFQWHVFTWDGVAEGYFTPPGASEAEQNWFRIALRLGAGGPSPTDSYGPLQVNLATGNVVIPHGGPAFPTVGGEAGVTLAYNAQAPATGLVASYFNDPTGTGQFSATPVLTRNDPSVAFTWGTDTAPGPGVGTDNYVVRWEGELVAPAAGDYLFYVGTTDGVKVFLNNSPTPALSRWPDPGASQTTNSTISAGAPVHLDGGQRLPIKIEYHEKDGRAQLAVAALFTPAGGGPGVAKMVDPSWLRNELAALPEGWTLGATGGLRYVAARAFEHGVTLTDAGGGLHTYARNVSGYDPPPGEDGVLAVNTDGTLTLLADSGIAYVFDNLGQLMSATAPDDGVGSPGANATGINYAFSEVNRPRRLETLRDPVSGREVTLHYGGGFNPALPCPDSSVPPDQLCRVGYWDGTYTDLQYNPNRQLAQIVHPGGAVWDLAYNGAGLLSTVRDPLAVDAVASASAPDDDTSRTLIKYYEDGSRRVEWITPPVPKAGAPRPAHRYSYDHGSPWTGTWVRVDGLSGDDEPHGFNRRVAVDGAGRVTDDTDATAKTTHFEWDGEDRLVATTDPANRRSTTVYDGDAVDAPRARPTGRVSDTYGPAPAGCFAGLVPNGSCSVPPPHTATVYDTVSGSDSHGLLMTAWKNPGYGGPPTARQLAAPDANGVLVAGTPPGLPSGGWSARYTGELQLAAGSHSFTLSATGGTAKLFVDDKLVADSALGPLPPVVDSQPRRHRVRVDFAATSGSPLLTLFRSSQPLGPTALYPRIANPTRTTVEDDSSVPSRVTEIVYQSLPQGIVEKHKVDPGGLNLVTTIAYGAEGPRRPKSRTLPGGDVPGDDSDPAHDDRFTATEYAYYLDTGTGPAACGQASGVPQAGRLRLSTAPSPDGTGAGRRATEVLHDTAGRVKATRLVGETDWSCRTYDARGRLTRLTVPSAPETPGQGGHIFDYSYAVGNNPLVGSIIEGTSVITTTVDLLGRIVSYTDIWGKITTSSYDQAGRRTDTSGPAGAIHVDFDPTGRIEAQTLDGAVMATAHYDANGELQSVAYTAALNGGNGTSLSAVGRHPTGMVTSLTWTGVGPVTLATDVVFRSRSGKVVDETIDGTDARPAGFNFSYDGAGRLTEAHVPGQHLAYDFDAPAECAAQRAGRNANRGAASVVGGGTTTYCYDRADRLVSSSDPAVGTPTYDSRGNTETLGSQTLGYDGADRHMRTEAGSTTVTYQRDPTGRIIERTEGATTVLYGYAGPGDSPAFVMNTSKAVIERTVALVGGVLVTKRGGLLGVGDVWSYPNVHGDVIATADHFGVKQGATLAYDPLGKALGAIADNGAGNFDYGWLGQHQRPLEHAGTIATIEMGARQYVPSIGRFLSVDPVGGGSANDYDYVNGDPVNGLDLDGLWPHRWKKQSTGRSKQGQHDQGEARERADRPGGEKGDDRRPYPPKRFGGKGQKKRGNASVTIEQQPQMPGIFVPDALPGLTIESSDIDAMSVCTGPGNGTDISPGGGFGLAINSTVAALSPNGRLGFEC